MQSCETVVLKRTKTHLFLRVSCIFVYVRTMYVYIDIDVYVYIYIYICMYVYICVCFSAQHELSKIYWEA